MKHLKEFKELCIHRTFISLLWCVGMLVVSYNGRDDAEFSMIAAAVAGGLFILGVVSSFFWEMANALIKEKEKG